MFTIINSASRECIQDRGQVLAFPEKNNAEAYLGLYLDSSYEVVDYCPNVSIRVVSMDYTLVALLAG